MKGKPVSWSSGNAFVSGAGGVRFKSRAVKSDTVLPKARHRCDISSKGAVLPRRNDTEIGSDKLVTRFGVIQRV